MSRRGLHGKFRGWGNMWRHLLRTAANPGGVVALAVVVGVMLVIGGLVSPELSVVWVNATNAPSATTTSTEPRAAIVADAAPDTTTTTGTVASGGSTAAPTSDTTTSETSTSARDGTATSSAFTIGELAAGEVTVERFVTFWEAELERIGTATCPATPEARSTVVTMAVGATPPAELGEAYPDYAPLLAAAHDAAATRCAGRR